MTVQILNDDCISAMRLEIDDGSINCVVTSPPYFGLRDYGVAGQIGLEETPEEYVAKLVDVFREVRHVLRDDGTVWLVLGDSYANSAKSGPQGKTGQRANRRHTQEGCGGVPPGLKSKDLIGIPWMVAFALRADGWYLRQEIIWAKPNPMPESVKDRCTKSHENMFLLSKKAQYYYDYEAIKEPSIAAGRVPGGNKSIDKSRKDQSRDMSIPIPDMRNKRDVWTVASQPFKGAKTYHWVRVGLDAVCGDTMRKASGDCPVHDHPDHLHGGREASTKSRIPDRHLNPAQSQEPSHAANSTHPERQNPLSNSDLRAHACDPAATNHNNETHKTGRVLETNAPCTPSSEILSHTGRKLVRRDPSAPRLDTYENSTVADVSDDSPNSRSADRIVHSELLPVFSGALDKASLANCTCVLYNKTAKRSSHFATFPPKLIEPCILAGCPVGGTVLDPFGGAGTVGLVAEQHDRNAILIELNSEYAEMARKRIGEMT